MKDQIKVKIKDGDDNVYKEINYCQSLTNLGHTTLLESEEEDIYLAPERAHSMLDWSKLQNKNQIDFILAKTIQHQLYRYTHTQQREGVEGVISSYEVLTRDVDNGIKNDLDLQHLAQCEEVFSLLCLQHSVQEYCLYLMFQNNLDQLLEQYFYFQEHQFLYIQCRYQCGDLIKLIRMIMQNQLIVLLGKLFGFSFLVIFQCFGYLLSFVYIVYAFGSGVSYQIISYIQPLQLIFIPEILKNFGVSSEIADSQNAKYIQVAALNFILLPVVLVRDLSALSHFNLLGIVAILYIILVVVGEMPQYMQQNWEYNDFAYYDFSLATFQGFAITIFAYTCHTNIFAVKIELTDAIERRMKKIFFRSVFWEMLLYMSIAVTGYLSFLKNTPELVIQRPKLVGSSDVLMIIARIAMTFNLITCLPLSIHPMRRELLLKVFKLKREPNKIQHFMITVVLVIVSCFIAVLFPDIINAFSLIGGTCSTGLVIFFPGMVFVKLSKNKWSHIKTICAFLLTILLTLLGLTATLVSLLSMMGVIQTNQ